MAALLSSEMDGAERDKFFVEHIDDCRRMGIEVLPPDVNEGESTFRVAERGEDPLRPGGDQGGRRQGGRGDRQGPRARAGRSAASTTSSSGSRPGRSSQALRRDADQGRGVRLPGGPAEPVAGRPAPRRPGRPGQAGRPQARPARPLRRPRGASRPTANGNGHGNGHAPAIEPARRPRAARRRAAGRGEEGARLLHVEPPADPPRRPAPGAGDPPAWPTSPAVPEKAEVILGGMIASVQVRNVQKSRSGLTRMAKLTFEDLTGSTPAMLWPEEFAKIERPGQERPDRLRQGDARPPPRPGRADHQQDHPDRARRPPSWPAGSSSGSTRGCTRTEDLERLLRLRPGPPGQPRPLPRDPRPRAASAGPSTRPAPRCKIRHDDRLIADLESVPSAPATSACSASAGRPPGRARRAARSAPPAAASPGPRSTWTTSRPTNRTTIERSGRPAGSSSDLAPISREASHLDRASVSIIRVVHEHVAESCALTIAGLSPRCLARRARSVHLAIAFVLMRTTSMCRLRFTKLRLGRDR